MLNIYKVPIIKIKFLLHDYFYLYQNKIFFPKVLVLV